MRLAGCQHPFQLDLVECACAKTCQTPMVPLTSIAWRMQRVAAPGASRPQPGSEGVADASFPLAALRHIFGRPVEPAQSADAAAATVGQGPASGSAAPDTEGGAEVAVPAEQAAPAAAHAHAEANQPTEQRSARERDPAAADAVAAEGQSQAKAEPSVDPDAAHAVAESAPVDAAEAGPAVVKTCSRCAAATPGMGAPCQCDCRFLTPSNHQFQISPHMTSCTYRCSILSQG